MQRKRLALVLSILLILGLALSGCAARPGQGELAASATAESLVVDVPALVINYDDQGKASFSGVELSVLGAALGQDSVRLDLSPELMAKAPEGGHPACVRQYHAGWPYPLRQRAAHPEPGLDARAPCQAGRAAGQHGQSLPGAGSRACCRS